MTEFRRVRGYEDLYVVSSNGCVFRIVGDRLRPLRQYKHTRGYLKVDLFDNYHRDKRYVHRIVAEAFLDNPRGLPEINHKDENKQNNRVENLEWCDGKYNCNYGSHCEKLGRPVEQLDEDGNVLKLWKTAADAMRTLGIEGTGIGACCRGKRQHCGGYRWRYAT